MSDKECFPRIIPGCIGAELHHIKDNLYKAEIKVAYKMFNLQSSAQVIMSPNQIMVETNESSLFENLKITFDLSEGVKDISESCLIDASFHMKPRWRPVGSMIKVIADTIKNTTIASFLREAKEIYGAPSIEDIDVE